MTNCFYPVRGEKYLYLFLWVFLFAALGRIFAAPLETGFELAPAAVASPEEKTAAFKEARIRLLAAAARYERTPYRYGGIDRNGMDCSGFVYASFKDGLAVSVPRSTTGLYSWVEKIGTEKLQPGDLVFFKTTNSGGISHVGIYVGGNRFIHSASEGPSTGVIYSGLDEKYWARTYTGAGRALPAADIYAPGGQIPTAPKNGDTSGQNDGISKSDASTKNPAVSKEIKPETGNETRRKTALAKTDENNRHIFWGFAAAPSWNGFLADGNIIRGVAGHLRAGIETDVFPRPMVFGMELRMEWDRTLGVFRLPITFSWGFNDKFRIFGGPVFSFGDAVLKTSKGDRHYVSGSNWFGALGITYAPFSIKIAQGKLAPYGELAWQAYFSDNNQFDLNSDFAAGIRFSTGLRYTWK
jgi:probable lipoprotein NlpC